VGVGGCRTEARSTRPHVPLAPLITPPPQCRVTHRCCTHYQNLRLQPQSPQTKSTHVCACPPFRVAGLLEVRAGAVPLGSALREGLAALGCPTRPSPGRCSLRRDRPGCHTRVHLAINCWQSASHLALPPTTGMQLLALSDIRPSLLVARRLPPRLLRPLLSLFRG
jgi:hypothetical protein